MKIVDWKLIDRNHTTTGVAECAKHRWKSFSGVYLILRDDNGNTGFGEASPLVGHSPDTLDESKTALSSYLATIAPKPNPSIDPLTLPTATTIPTAAENHIETVSDVARVSNQIPKRFPAARFALETALLDLWAQKKSVPLWKLFTSTPRAIQVNGLLSKSHFTSHATQMYNDGIRVFKIKLGAKNEHKAELDRLQWLRNQFGDTVEIRLDANEGIPPDLIVERMNALAAVSPSFIEEPTVFNSYFPPEPLPFPFAADESLTHSPNIEPLLNRRDCSTFVCKPSLLGGFFRVFELADLARQNHKQVIVTHMFESLPGFLATVHLAIAVNTYAPCGLFPHFGLGNQRTHSTFTITNGSLSLADAPGLGITTNDILGEEK